MIHRPGAVETGMLSGVGDQRENLLCRRVDDPFHGDAVSLHAPTIASRHRVNRPAGRRCASALRRVRYVPRVHARAARWCRSRTPRPEQPSAPSTMRSRIRQSLATVRMVCDLPAPVCDDRLSSITVSISAGASSGRSCATGLRRSITSSTRRNAASAKMTAVRGGSASRTGAWCSPAWPEWAVFALRVGATSVSIGTRRCRLAAARSRPPGKPKGSPVPGLRVGPCEGKAPAQGSGMLSWDALRR